MGRISLVTKRAVYCARYRFDSTEPNILLAPKKRYGIETGDASAVFLVNCGGDGDTFRDFSFSALGMPELRKTIFRPLLLEEISRTVVELLELQFAEIRRFDF